MTERRCIIQGERKKKLWFLFFSSSSSFMVVGGWGICVCKTRAKDGWDGVLRISARGGERDERTHWEEEDFFLFWKLRPPSRFVLRKEPRVGPAHSRGDQWHPMGSRGQRPAPLEISSGLVADFLSADGGEGEGGKKTTTTTTFLFFFPFIFPYLLSSFSCLVLFTRESRSRYRRQYTAGKRKRKRKRRRETGRNDKKSAKGGKCKSTCRHNLHESICLYRVPVPHLLIMEREIEMGFLFPDDNWERGKKTTAAGMSNIIWWKINFKFHHFNCHILGINGIGCCRHSRSLSLSLCVCLILTESLLCICAYYTKAMKKEEEEDC